MPCPRQWPVPPHLVESYKRRVEYAKVLYDIPGQASLPHPHGSLPHEPPFLLHNVRKAIDQLQFGKTQDHNGLVGEHFIYDHDILLPLLAQIFNRDLWESTHMAHSHMNLPFLLHNVRKAIDQLQFGKAQDHDGWLCL